MARLLSAVLVGLVIVASAAQAEASELPPRRRASAIKTAIKRTPSPGFGRSLPRQVALPPPFVSAFPPGTLSPVMVSSIVGDEFRNLSSLAFSGDGSRAFGTKQDESTGTTYAAMANITMDSGEVYKTFSDANFLAYPFSFLNHNGSLLYITNSSSIDVYSTNGSSLGAPKASFYRLGSRNVRDPFSTPLALFPTQGGDFWVTAYGAYNLTDFTQILQIVIYSMHNNSLFANFSVPNGALLGNVPTLAVSASGRRVAVGGLRNALNIITLSPNGSMAAPIMTLRPFGALWHMAFTPDEMGLAAVTRRRLVIFNLTTLATNPAALTNLRLSAPFNVSLPERISFAFFPSPPAPPPSTEWEDPLAPRLGDFLPTLAFSTDGAYVFYLNAWEPGALYSSAAYDTVTGKQVAWDLAAALVPFNPQYATGGVYGGKVMLVDKLTDVEIWRMTE